MAQLTTFGRLSLALCLVLALEWRAEAGESDSLTDAGVQDILARESVGVFYAWSPHMPLSVDGLTEILAAGDSLDLAVIPLLSQHANVDYARDRIAGRGHSEGVLRQSESGELIKRDLFVHAPAILVFKNGEFVSPVLPGFRHAADYEQLIGRFLESAGE